MAAYAVLAVAMGKLLGRAGDQYQVQAHYLKHEYQIPMRDGTHLFTAVYEPRDFSRTYPILMTRTPYGIEPYGESNYPEILGPSHKFDADGFIYVFQDVRGRYMSEGTWQEMTPMKEHRPGSHEVDESTDAYDTIDWLLKNVHRQNGKVGLLGISYPGFYTSAGMIDAHPALIAASPQAPVSNLFMGDDAYHNGALFLLANFTFYTDFPKQHNPQYPDPETKFHYGTKDGYRFFLHLGSVSKSEKYFRNQNPYWTDTYKNWRYDEYWKARDILPHLRNIRPAVLLVGGWFDAEDLSGTLKTYRALKEQSPDTALTLAMGPWWHGGWENRTAAQLGDIPFGSFTAAFFEDEIELPFFRHYLKGAPDPKLPGAYVFRTGSNVWNQEVSWPPVPALPYRLYLQGGRELKSVAPAEPSAFDEYISDPEHPVPFFAKPTLQMNRDYMDGDQRFVANRPDVLTYQSEILDQDMTAAGPISVSLYVSTSGTDSDFDVKFIDCYPEAAKARSGYQELVRGEPFRAKFRHSFSDPQPMVPGRVEPIQFQMPDVDHCFRKGHRLMVQIQSSWFPLTDRNPQVFTDIPFAKAGQFQKATQRIYHGQDTPSYVEINLEASRSD